MRAEDRMIGDTKNPKAEPNMPTITVTSDYRITIPKEVRDALGIEPGQQVDVMQSGDRIELVPVQPMQDARGFLEGMSTELERDEDRL
jgi:AbrB family looped-hinge helix DNA binding protein